MLRPIFLASQLVMGTSSVRQFIQFSIPIRRFFTRGRDPGLVISAARLRAADGPNRSLQLARNDAPNRTIGQTPPDQANELLAQILDTSNEAVELREQLLAALSQELELLASLQEQHLFPVLEQNPETADLVRGARDDYQQTKVLLNRLAATPKDSDAFLAKVAELRKVFQQHSATTRTSCYRWY